MGANEGYSSVECSCGSSFGTYSEFEEHVREDHGLPTG